MDGGMIRDQVRGWRGDRLWEDEVTQSCIVAGRTQGSRLMLGACLNEYNALTCPLWFLQYIRRVTHMEVLKLPSGVIFYFYISHCFVSFPGNVDEPNRLPSSAHPFPQ